MDPSDYFEITRGKPMHTEAIEVTPELAKAWLERNVVNRKLRRSHAKKLAWDIRRGRWDLTHQSIAFNTEGWLIDGQHRLHAIIEAGVSVWLYVSFNVAARFASAIDVGIIRTAGDVLGRSNRDTAVCNALIQLETRSKSSAPVSKLEEVFEENRWAFDWARKALPMRRGITAGLVAGFVYAYPAAPTHVSAFTEAFNDFTGSDGTDPVVVLRKYVERARPGAGIDSSLAALRCLHAYREEQAITRLVVTELGFDYFAALRAHKVA
jgi:hypothetical protein